LSSQDLRVAVGSTFQKKRYSGGPRTGAKLEMRSGSHGISVQRGDIEKFNIG